MVAHGPNAAETMIEYAPLVDDFSIHDGLIVASHCAEDTDGVSTADGVIRDADLVSTPD